MTEPPRCFTYSCRRSLFYLSPNLRLANDFKQRFYIWIHHSMRPVGTNFQSSLSQPFLHTCKEWLLKPLRPFDEASVNRAMYVLCLSGLLIFPYFFRTWLSDTIHLLYIVFFRPCLFNFFSFCLWESHFPCQNTILYLRNCVIFGIFFN